ncbi:MAG: hypothetical protein HYW23_01225 [Candidatus Aenigmarchaeota archaeon]|nr:hypothetical protein [Candidatus Aenigmarchaeota archaeon]
MQQYIIPPHRPPNEDKIQEELLQYVINPDIQFILSGVKLPKKYKPFYWFQQENDKIILAFKIETEKFTVSYAKIQEIMRNDTSNTTIYTPFKELMRIVNSMRRLYEN